MNQEFSSNRARIIKANHLLQNKVGTGDIDDARISGMQKIMDTTIIDFVPMASKLLDELDAALKNAEVGTGDSTAQIAAMIVPVMQLKANGAMFHYELVSTLAELVLDFLENIDSLDDAALEIVAAHHRTLSLIVNNKMSGTGGNYGAQLEKELQDACHRFFSKKGRNAPVTARIKDLDQLPE